MAKIKPEDIRTGGSWEVFEVTPEYRRSRLWLDEDRYIQKTEYLADEKLQEVNSNLRDASKGVRLGEYTHVGSVPLNVLYGGESQIAEKLQEGDQDHLKWFLNSEAGKPFKTWWGKL